MSRHHLCSQLCWSLLRSQFHVATWLFLFLAEIDVATLKACRDINFAHPVATSLLSHNISNCTSHSYCRDINFRSRPRLESPTYIFVATRNCLSETLQVYSTLLSSREIFSLLRQTISYFLVAASKRCRNIIFFEVSPVLVSASALLSQQLLFGYHF